MLFRDEISGTASVVVVTISANVVVLLNLLDILNYDVDEAMLAIMIFFRTAHIFLWRVFLRQLCPLLRFR